MYYRLRLPLLLLSVLTFSGLHAQSDQSEDETAPTKYEFARVYLMNTQYFASNEVEEGTAIYSDGNYEDFTGQTMNAILNQFSADGWEMVNATRGGGDSYRAEFFYFQRPIKE